VAWVELGEDGDRELAVAAAQEATSSITLKTLAAAAAWRRCRPRIRPFWSITAKATSPARRAA
jgi:hypothetical protein